LAVLQDTELNQPRLQVYFITYHIYKADWFSGGRYMDKLSLCLGATRR